MVHELARESNPAILMYCADASASLAEAGQDVTPLLKILDENGNTDVRRVVREVTSRIGER